ncbi:hypothetical protein LEP1GSC052_3347 [Leptospira kmetyi serovar Malaysia str. Bejo-Iso9]|nr:hypothetical protein LEP1GSC052_3347 [Leptospira kmetyi serovar Malaysia str. Bejo-Iso9]
MFKIQGSDYNTGAFFPEFFFCRKFKNEIPWLRNRFRVAREFFYPKVLSGLGF